MRTSLLGIAFAILAIPAAAAAAGLTLYTQPGFAGRPLSLENDSPNLSGSGMQDQASSAVVDWGRWQVCTQPDFKGDCMVLEPGQYDSLDSRILHRIESVRRLGGHEGRADRYSYASGGNEAGSIELFAGTAFRGHLMDVDRDMRRLGRERDGMGVSSLVVNEGTWQLCSEPRFEGECRTFEPGRYRDIGRLNNQVGSIRRVG